MPKDLRTFLVRVKEEYPQGMVTITEEKGMLDPNECECTAILQQLAKSDRWPIVVFENISTLSRKRWPGQIVFSEMSSWPSVAIMLDLNPEKATVPETVNLLSQRGRNPKPWTVVKRADAPVKEIAWVGDEADNFRLPSYRKDSGDARPGWLSGIAVAKDLDTGRHNCSWHRHLVHSPTKSTARVNPRHLREIMQRYKKAGYEEIPIAWVYGHHPAFLLAASIRVGWEMDEYEFAGGLLGESLRLTRSETLGDEFLVPADAEVVVEGYLHLSEKDMNGPWTDFMLYYSPQTLEPVFRTTAITMRKNPIFSESWIGHDLIQTIGELTQMHLVLGQRFAGVKEINYVAPFTMVIQYKPKTPGEVNRLAACALGSLGDSVKNVIVVDEDIDPFDLSMVFYSIATRADAGSNRIQVIKDLSANRQDPSTERDFVVGGLVIDSTKPVNRPFPEIGCPPPELLDRIQLRDFLSSEEIGRIPVGRKHAR